MTKSTQDIVFVAGSGHSGSTLLELLLCTHPSCIGLGEVFQMVDEESTRIERLGHERCACGVVVQQCEFWGPLIPLLRGGTAHSTAERYQTVIRHFADRHPGKVLVDSSKSVRALSVLADVPDINLKVLHLIRDVRGWTVSRQDLLKRRPQDGVRDLVNTRGVFRGLRTYLKRSRIQAFREWYSTQRAIDQVIASRQLNARRLGYEQVCLSPDWILERVNTFLDLPRTTCPVDMSHAVSHNVFGNRMRFQPEKNSRISYDNRWFYRRDWVLPSLMFPRIMAYNTRVYLDEGRTIWDR